MDHRARGSGRPAGIVLAGTGLDPFEEEYRSYVVDAAILVITWSVLAVVGVALLWRLAVAPPPEARTDPS
ncbi:hypothetical protein Q0F99_09530 [Rathayibacter oskolensis]|uniref:hypothetical protein n=1 Tax=Rathayibacter oskolensis TaxID=1891671 RepID=UPI0026601E3F|nr:hypothetical protein [Rathayibacter oskolensis]WKK73057.1 hypothetical protein Q0F99_09530 [Rathayibacter oskolensis]